MKHFFPLMVFTTLGLYAFVIYEKGLNMDRLNVCIWALTSLVWYKKYTES